MGNESLKCPKCGTVFQISETDYESIAKQIRDKEFEKEVTQRDVQHEKDKLAQADKEKVMQKLINKYKIQKEKKDNSLLEKSKERIDNLTNK